MGSPVRRAPSPRLHILLLFAGALGQLPGLAESTAPTASAPQGGAIEVPALDPGSVRVVVDGVLDEAVWSRVEPLPTEHRVIEPETLDPVPHDTVIRVFSTKRGLFIGAFMEQPPETLVRRLTSRDSNINRDTISFTFDTSGQGRYGYWFSVALGSSLLDGTILPERQYSNEWDGPWRGRSAITDDGWTAEMFLPWSMLSMPAEQGRRRIAMYTSRRVAHRNERWAWPALPRTQPRFMSVLEPLSVRASASGQQWTAYPYLSANFDGRRDEFELNPGAELFWRPRPGLQLSATLNPDFGSVQTDDVVVNVEAFEVFFRERRPFFLEDQDIFETTPRADRGGRQRLTLLNTRRIGGPALAPLLGAEQRVDPVDLARNSDLHGALKATGNSGRLRYGLLTALEQDTDFLVDGPDGLSVLTQDGREFAAARLLYEDAAGAGYRQLGTLTTIVEHPQLSALVQGIDAHWLSGDGAIKLDTQSMYSRNRTGSGLDPVSTEGFGQTVDVVYTPRPGLTHELALAWFDDEVDVNAFGFQVRNDITEARYELTHVRTGLESVRRQETNLRTVYQVNGKGQVTSAGAFVTGSWQRYDLHEIEAIVGWRPARWDDVNSRGNGAFRVPHRPRARLEFRSDPSQPLAFSVFGVYNQEDTGGDRIELGGGVDYRPAGNFTLSLDLTHRTSEDWLIYQGGQDFTGFDARFWQPQLAADFFPSARQQFRLSVQWTGIKARERTFFEVPPTDGGLMPRAPDRDPDDFNRSDYALQFRYRWEFAPLSDLALVYTRAGRLREPYDPEADYQDLLTAAFEDPDEDRLVLRLRYRFGS